MHFEIESIREEVRKGPKFYTIQEAAEALKVHYITVYRLIVTGELDACKVAGVWRIPATALLKYLEENHPFNTED